MNVYYDQIILQEQRQQHMMEFVIVPVYQLGESQFVKHFPFSFDYGQMVFLKFSLHCLHISITEIVCCKKNYNDLAQRQKYFVIIFQYRFIGFYNGNLRPPFVL